MIQQLVLSEGLLQGVTSPWRKVKSVLHLHQFQIVSHTQHQCCYPRFRFIISVSNVPSCCCYLLCFCSFLPSLAAELLFSSCKLSFYCFALPVAAPPKSIAAPKKKVERTQSHKPRPTPPVADDNLPMASSLDNPLIQNNMLGARDATVLLLAQTRHSAHYAGSLLHDGPACMTVLLA